MTTQPQVDRAPADAALRAVTSSGWQARLRLRVGARDGRSRIVEREHEGPLVVQRPFYPEGDAVCHAYIVHPPGGIVGGDELRIRLDATDGGHVLVTTPAAAKLYRSAGATAVVDQRLTVSASSAIEWLPQESIAYDGSVSDLRTRVILEEGARFISWDVLTLGRPAADEAFATGRLGQRLELRRAGWPLIDERLTLEGSGVALHAPWGLGGHTTTGMLVAVGPVGVDATLLDRVREVLGEGTVLAAATVVSEALVVRVQAHRAREAFAALTAAWTAIRPVVLGRAAEPPRIWAT